MDLIHRTRWWRLGVIAVGLPDVEWLEHQRRYVHRSCLAARFSVSFGPHRSVAAPGRDIFLAGRQSEQPLRKKGGGAFTEMLRSVDGCCGGPGCMDRNDHERDRIGVLRDVLLSLDFTCLTQPKEKFFSVFQGWKV